MKTRFRRRIELRTDIAARDRVDAVLHDPPFDQRLDVDFVEGLKTVFREWRGRAQFAGAECRQRPAALIICAIISKPCFSGTTREKRTRSMVKPGSAPMPQEYWLTPGMNR